MPAGRPRKAPNERRIEGNRSKSPIPVDLFTPEGAPFVPDHLPEEAQKCAEYILKSFKTKHISGPDSYVLAAFATAWAWHKAAVHEMAAPGFRPTVPGSSGQDIVNPWFKILNEQARIMVTLATKLYLTPADRARIDSGSDMPKSKFGELIAIQGGRKAS